MKKIDNHQDQRFSECLSMALCPKCGSEMKELWLTHTKANVERKRIKRNNVICTKCNFDLASVKQPKGRLVQRIK